MHKDVSVKIARRIIMLACVFPGLVTAQADPSVETAPEAHQTAGIDASVELTWLHDDNIFATPSDTVADQVVLLTPALNMALHSADLDITTDLGANFGRHQSNPGEDFDDYWLTAKGRLKVDRQFHLFAGIGTRQGHEQRDSPDDDRSGEQPTTWRSHNADLGALFGLGADRLRVGGTVESLRFDDVPRVDGVLINRDRNRDNYGLGVRFAHGLSANGRVFAQAQYDVRNYVQVVDSNGYARDSHGYRVALGFRQGQDDGDAIEAYLGYLAQSYASSAFDDVHAADFGLTLSMGAGRLGNWSVEVRRELMETTQAGASGYLQTDLDLTLDVRLSDRWQLRCNAYYGISDYQQVDRDDRVKGLSARIEYSISPAVFAALEYGWTQRRVDDASAPPPEYGSALDFDRNQLWLTLGALWGVSGNR